MLFKSPPSLTPEDTKKEELKNELNNRLLRCQEHLEAIQILVGNDLDRDAAHLLRPYLLDLGNTLLRIDGQTEVSEIERLPKALDEINGEKVSAAAAKLKEITDEYLKSTADSAETKKLISRATRHEVVASVEKAYHRKLREDLATPMDAYRRRKRRIYIMWIILIPILLYLAINVRASWKRQSFRERRVKDLMALADALQRFKADNGKYPVTGERWDGRKTCWGQSKEDWIPGLVPKYIAKLPTDPRNSEDCAKHYIYRSDGENYKLVAHSPDDMPELKKKFPQMMDPQRQGRAIGVWSTGGKNF